MICGVSSTYAFNSRPVQAEAAPEGAAKLLRGHARDLLDVEAMLERHLVTPLEIKTAMSEIRPQLIRFPGLDAETFEKRVQELLEKQQ